MFADFHIHTNFSGDSNTPVEEQIKKAIALGMKEICITDHHDFDVNSGDINFNLNFDQYLPYLTKVKTQYQDRIKVRIGLELGLQTHLIDYHTQLLRQYSFDFIIGSTHYMDGLDPYYPSFFDNREEADIFHDFFLITQQNLKAFDNFDVLGHLDYIVRYGPNKNTNYHYHDYLDVIDLIFSDCITKGIGIECNSSGFRHGIKQPNPHGGILKRYRELGGEIITIGSDAHRPIDLGSDFDLVKEILLASGFRYYTTFEDRKPFFHAIE